MINYFNFQKFKNKYLITNDLGRYDFLDVSQFKRLLTDNLPADSEEGKRLREKFFVYDSDDEQFSRLVSFEMYYSKNYLFKSTSLHIFVLTSACNQSCVYCQAQSEKSCSKGFMSKDTAKKAVDIAIQSPTDYLDFEFQGGEPLLNFEVLKYIVEYAKSISHKKISFSVVSNLTLLTQEMIGFIKYHHISVSTSLDGDEALHNANRPYQNGGGTFCDVTQKIHQLRNNGIYVGAIQTTTKASLQHYKEIIDTYVKLGFHSVFIRPLTPLGYAGEHWDEIGYSADDFTVFYRKTLAYILKINREGYALSEGHAKTFLMKLIDGFSPNYMELRSPCGAALGQLAYYYDGNIFTCDEARMLYEMGDASFCVGNVDASDYNSILESKVSALTSKASVLESLPSCSDCVYQPYCGVCPVVNYAINQDIYEITPREYKCKIYSGMLENIFDYFYHNDTENTDIFRRWLS